MVPAPVTFERRADAERWLAQEELTIASGDWVNPDAGLIPLGDFAATLRRSNFSKFWARSLDAAGIDRSVRFHDLRHTGNTLAAQAGAAMSDLMARMGHASTP